MSIVRIQSISDPIADRNGNNYKVITLEAPGFKEVTDPRTGKSILALASPKTTKKCVWESSYLDGTKHYMYDAEVGQPVYGSIYTASVAPYDITDENGETRTVDTYTGFVEAMPSNANFNSAVASMIRDAGQELAGNSAKNFNVAQEHQNDSEVEELARVSAEEQVNEDSFAE